MRLDVVSIFPEYFAPLQEWLKQQNEGQMCGWQAGPAQPVKPAAPRSCAGSTRTSCMVE